MKYITLKKTQVKKIALGLVLVLVMGITQVRTAAASTLSNAKDKKAQTENELNSVNNQISDIEDEQAALRGQINRLDEELVEIILSISVLEDDLVVKEGELKQVQADLEQAKKDEAGQYEAMKKRIRFMYERGDTTFITSLLENESISDLLNKVDFINNVYDYDRELLTAYQEAKEKVEQLEKDVQSEIVEQEELKANYQQEQSQYEALIAEKKTQVADFDSKLSDAKSLAARYKETIQEQNSIIREEEEKIRQEEIARQQEAERQAAAEASGSGTDSPGDEGSSGGNDSDGGSESGSGGGSDPGCGTGVDGNAIVSYASSFIGNKYVWGGTDPNTGADCSGFTQYVYAQFGVPIPRTAGGQRSAGQEVSYANAQPGDLICYSGHVAIYMGNGQIVHASNSAPYPAGGIKTGTATYRTILSVRRVL